MNRKTILTLMSFTTLPFLISCSEFNASSKNKFSVLKSVNVLEQFDGNDAQSLGEQLDQFDGGVNEGDVGERGDTGARNPRGKEPKTPSSDGGNLASNNQQAQTIVPVEISTIKINRGCSDSRSMSQTPAALVSDIKVRVVGPSATESNVVKCELNGVKSEILSGSLNLSSCGTKIYSNYGFEVLFDGVLYKKMWPHGDGSAGISVLIADNPSADHYTGPDMPSGTYEKCDYKASPLFVDLRSTKTHHIPLRLTSPEDGIQYDILGERAQPSAHTKMQISWLTTRAIAFLTLPNSKGEVNGINELFGDNTRGPDGKFAKNGFLALEKFDSSVDRQINEQDEVFSELRLWVDANFDGKAQAYELFSMGEAGVEMIDLVYDPNFSEKDKYGNEVKYKSVVRMINGDYKLIFDLWFQAYAL